MSGVSLTAEGPVATLVLDNPPLNVLSIALREALYAQIAALHARPDLRVLIVRTEGERAFSVGSDIREFPADAVGGVAKIRFEQHLLDSLAALPQVTVARLQGMALGGGAELMLACDLRIAAAGIAIGFPEIRLGALPAAGGMKRLVQELGPAQARQLVLLGRPIPAERALALGLVSEVVAADALDARIAELAAELAALPASALRQGKRAIAGIAQGGPADTLEAESFAALFGEADLAEGLQAFLDKRPAGFNRG